MNEKYNKLKKHKNKYFGLVWRNIYFKKKKPRWL